ncbi:hypothetical protein CK203_024127 [Vitis vinifera]|uniref:Retroviral polymerase SH3-like domain-containing protein n=1 Tax=Vitis vinifera TaxID=29760 RepID=A0A438I4M6_VITVI|nr:hypothetical protein CK203_024127 [Vitis vinifera]
MEVEASFSSIALPVFNGDNYQIWAVRMETYLEALDLWEAIKEDYDILVLPNNPTIAQIKAHKEKKTKKSKAKACLFAVVSPTIFTRVMSLKTAKAIWDYLQEEYVGDEMIKDKLLSIANKVRLLGSKLNDSRIVEKIFVMMPERTGNFKGKYPPCQHYENKGHPPLRCWRRPDAKCSKCNKFGHEAVICKYKNQIQEADAQVADQEEEDQFLLPFASQVKRDKLDKKLEPNIFVGYSSSSKAYKVYQPQTGKLIVSRDVFFNEDEK